MNQKQSFSNRQNSLKYYKEQGLNEIPTFLTQGDAAPTPAPAKPKTQTDVVTIKTTTLLGFMAFITILGAALYGVGYSVAYYTHANQTASAPVVKKSAPKLAPVVQPKEGLIVTQAPEPVTTTPPVIEPKFTIEFGEAEELQVANNIAQQLNSNQMPAILNQTQDKSGKIIFKIVSTSIFASQDGAKSHLDTLKKPYSNWGKVIKVNATQTDTQQI